MYGHNPLQAGALVGIDPLVGYSVVVNSAPTLADATLTVAEDVSIGAVVGTVTGADVDLDTLTYSIVSGNTDGDLTINSVTGQITTVNTLSFIRTASYSLIVEVVDGELAGQGAITINIDRTPGVWIAQPDVVTVWTVL